MSMLQRSPSKRYSLCHLRLDSNFQNGSLPVYSVHKFLTLSALLSTLSIAGLARANSGSTGTTLTYTGHVTKVLVERNSNGSIGYYHIYFDQTMSTGTCSSSNIQADTARAVVQAGTAYGDSAQKLGTAALLTRALVTWTVNSTTCDIYPSVVSLLTMQVCPAGASSC
jgi:hypothetical protein